MQKITQTAICISLSIVIMLISLTTTAQQKPASTAIENAVNKKTFVFMAEYISPLSGRARYLNYGYDVIVLPDSVVSNLPYFGSAQVAPMNSEDAGINFTSTLFAYTFKPGKKNSWSIAIKTKDQKDGSEFNFIIYNDGIASLNVNSNFRDPVSFRGYIKI